VNLASPSLKGRIRRVPMVGPAVANAVGIVRRQIFPGSQKYWERRYRAGGTSGEGSVGLLAHFKAEILNDFVVAEAVESVIEFGCGDGRQLALAIYPKYLGLDVSPTTLRQTMDKFSNDSTKSFMLYRPDCFSDAAALMTADLSMSLDVIYHLVEDHIYQLHLRHIFGSARRFVVLFTSDDDSLDVTERVPPHIRHRPVLDDIAERFPEWRLRERIVNRYPYEGTSFTVTSFADFFIFDRASGHPSAIKATNARC
jgi:SAM-dependent methyltransferase